MMFPKYNTNTGGECLCDSCIHNDLWLINCEPTVMCRKDQELHYNVGICKDFMRVNDNG